MQVKYRVAMLLRTRLGFVRETNPCEPNAANGGAEAAEVGPVDPLPKEHQFAMTREFEALQKQLELARQTQDEQLKANLERQAAQRRTEITTTHASPTTGSPRN